MDSAAAAADLSKEKIGKGDSGEMYKSAFSDGR